MVRTRTALAALLLGVCPLAGCAGLEVTMPSSTPSETTTVPATPTGEPTASPTGSPTAGPTASGTASPTAAPPSATGSPRNTASPSASPGALEVGLAAVELRQGGDFTYKANGAAPADDYVVQATCTGGSTARITFTVTVAGGEAMFGGLSCDGAWDEFTGYDALEGLRGTSPDIAIDVQREGTISGGFVRVVPAGTPWR